MKNMTQKLFHKMISLALVTVMALSVIYAAFPTEISAAGKSFKSTGKSSVTITDDEDYSATGEATWIKYKATANGYLKITASMSSTAYSDYVYGYWVLYNSKKNTIVSPSLAYNTKYADSSYYSDVFGVKKGVTYYLNVTAVGGVKINASFTKVSDKSGSKKAKALNIKKGKSVTGLIRAGDTNSDWYKFTLTSKKNLTIIITPYFNDSVTLTISGGNLEKSSGQLSTRFYGKKVALRVVSKSTSQVIQASAGTYYIQVKPTKKTTSGYYKLTWK